jgi:four helix bundle protein
VLHSSTATGALVQEAEHTASKVDFTHKMNLALKEANETLYWLDLLHQAEYIADQSCASIRIDNEELVKLLIAIVKTSRDGTHAN